MKIFCPNCKNDKKFYHLKDGRLKCSVCKIYFTPGKKTIHISKEQLNKIIDAFLKNKTTNEILKETKITKFRLLKIKNIIRDELKKKIKLNFNKINNSVLQKEMTTFEKCCCILNKQNKNFIHFLEKATKGRGGIRENNLKDFIYENFWKYKNQSKTLEDKKKELFNLVKDKIWFVD